MESPSYWNHNSAYYPWVCRQAAGRRRVLDVGCGDGELAFLLANEGHEVTGIDPSEDCIARARKRASDERVAFLCCAFDELDAEDGSYDAITFVASLHHMDMGEAVRKAKALLSAGGVLLVVGLASPSSPLDHVVDTLRVIPSWASSRIHRMAASEDLGIPTSYDVPTMAQVRDLARHCLPGATERRALHWRYLLRWQKGC